MAAAFKSPACSQQRVQGARRHHTRCCSHSQQHPGDVSPSPAASRRDLLAAAALTAVIAGVTTLPLDAQAGPVNPLGIKKALAARRRKIPASEYKDGPDGLKYYDLQEGTGQECAAGQRVVIHFDVKWKGVTFMTSRQGIGVTGGTPFGFDVGAPSGTAGSTLPGIDLGVRGMKVGGLRRLIVPPNLAYGSKGVGEIPPNADIEVELELLSIKSNALGFQVKLVEG